MGDPKKSRKKWESPGHPWIKERIGYEQELLGKYGLRNKREIWIAQSIIRKFRHQARSLLALPPAERAVREKQLVGKLLKMALLKRETATVDDILSLTEQDLLERRLQTIVYKKGLANTTYQARQLIIHGHIAVNGKRVTSPGYIVNVDEENLIDYYVTSSFKSRPPVMAQQEGGEAGVKQA
ncbi:30S ribosomal protein S4 [Saccharolobus islandicus]|uniref:Small ribosomal subunit protein uS4 n=1 Tax=Saccharolobus islandicus (strain HVE10/4) TaxID=930943 RepID=F0NL01_SACI0|nr:30S ribosomal protein S4 [Sulfolobus islandicus]ADX83338.1 ribosomal protein S4 [Sulfolobus islandicus HVE10/4]